MKRIILMWLVTLVFTGAFLVWQKVSGPTYEVRVSSEVGGLAVKGELLRTHSINGDMPVILNVGDPGLGNPGVRGTVIWRRYPTDDPWERQLMTYENGQLRTTLPAQPMAGKVEYTVEIQSDAELRDPGHTGTITSGQVGFFPPESKGPAVARFKGDVPGLILGFHVVCMILGMFFSTGAGLEALTRGRQLLILSRLAFGFLLLGGLILGPVVQKYAFDAFWTGWPLGQDWTDNKLAVGAIVWLITMLLVARGARPSTAAKDKPGLPYGAVARWSAVVSMLVILVVYGIPHSIHGSTFDYDTGEHVQRM
nr:hypothetical protein [Candidatus Krumholzibacteria bacterium]